MANETVLHKSRRRRKPGPRSRAFFLSAVFMLVVRGEEFSPPRNATVYFPDGIVKV
jgi:hypothetical protein